METGLLYFALGFLAGWTFTVFVVVRYAIRFLRILREELEKQQPAPRPRLVKKQEPKAETAPLPFNKPEEPKPPRTNFDPTEPMVPFARPSMRSYLARLQKAETGPLVSK